MKSLPTLLSTFLKCSVFLCISSFSSGNSCDPDEFLKKHAEALDDYVFIKSFPIETGKSTEKVEYSYVLSRGMNYRIVICDQDEAGKKMIVNLLDRNKKLIASNYLKSNKKFYGTLNYVCAATGVYYVEAFFEDEKKSCGLTILGFKK